VAGTVCAEEVPGPSLQHAHEVREQMERTQCEGNNGGDILQCGRKERRDSRCRHDSLTAQTTWQDDLLRACSTRATCRLLNPWMNVSGRVGPHCVPGLSAKRTSVDCSLLQEVDQYN
jgi:hypothetical protein